MATGNEVLVKGIPYSSTEKDIRKVFEEFGQVESVHIPVYRDSGRKKGICFVMFSNSEAADKAVESMNNKQIEDRTVTVKLAQGAPPNYPASQDNNNTNNKNDSEEKRSSGYRDSNRNEAADRGRDRSNDKYSSLTVFVGSLPFSTDDKQLRDFFADCGEINHIRLPVHHDSGRSKGIAYVDFATSSGAAAAIAMNGQDLEGRSLRINYAPEKKDWSNSSYGRRDYGRDNGNYSYRNNGNRYADSNNNGYRSGNDGNGGGYRNNRDNYRDNYNFKNNY